MQLDMPFVMQICRNRVELQYILYSTIVYWKYTVLPIWCDTLELVIVANTSCDVLWHWDKNIVNNSVLGLKLSAELRVVDLALSIVECTDKTRLKEQVAFAFKTFNCWRFK